MGERDHGSRQQEMKIRFFIGGRREKRNSAKWKKIHIDEVSPYLTPPKAIA
jgi:hypothetical protein